MATIQEALTEGLRLHQAGKLIEAERIYQEIVRVAPKHAKAWNLLSMVAFQTGRPREAVERGERAIALHPDAPEFLVNLGSAQVELGQLEKAIAVYQRALAIAPDFQLAITNLAIAYGLVGRPQTALELLQQADQASPNSPDILFQMGNLCEQMNNTDAAMSHYRRVLQLNPNHPQAAFNLGVLSGNQGQLQEALEYYRVAVRCKPDHVAALNNLGRLYVDLGRYGEALHTLERALGYEPKHPGTHMNLGLLRLLLGDFERGWAEYEWRTQVQPTKWPKYPVPVWDGTPNPTQTILLQAEQGAGDAFQFIRYAKLVRERVRRVYVRCRPELVGLLSKCQGVDACFSTDERLPSFDAYVLLMSLPKVCGTTLETIPGECPYLLAEHASVTKWQTKLKPLTKFRVGIAWSGSPLHHRDRWRSFPLSKFRVLAEREEIELVNLQMIHGTEQLQDWSGPKIHDFTGEIDHAVGFDELAGLISNLDLVITCDTSLAHLSGALGVRCWVVLASTLDWRWGLQTDDSPWYPTVRLFRQTRLGEWDLSFRQIVWALEELVATRRCE
ncbi:MAG: tetratricopeptide repeat protein [Gemmataceae bacterium]